MSGANKRGTFGVSLLSTAGFNRLLPAATAICPCLSAHRRVPGLETAWYLANVGLSEIFSPFVKVVTHLDRSGEHF
jgi:hypothetical protein